MVEKFLLGLSIAHCAFYGGPIIDFFTLLLEKCCVFNWSSSTVLVAKNEKSICMPGFVIANERQNNKER